MDAAQVLGDVVIGVAVALAYVAAWIAWLTLGILPFVLAGLAYLLVRDGVPAATRAGLGAVRRSWDSLRHAARQFAPRHTSTRAARV